MSKWCPECERVGKEEFTFCPECGSELEIVENAKTNVFLHSDKETMWNKGEELGLDGKALEKFMYTGYEVKIEVEVDIKTGEAFATYIQGVKLETPVKV